MAGENVQTFTDGNFSEDVLQSPRPVLVDFWAEWCAPCRRIAPAIDALAVDFDGRAVVGKLNVDDNPGITSRYSVMSIPTLLLFKGGEVVEALTGLADKEQLRQLVEKHL